MLKLSIIIPAHDAADTLPITLQSIQVQTYPLIETIVICDSCKDNTEEIARSYPWVTVLTCNHSKPGPTRNEGLKIATGDYVWCIDADDMLYFRNSVECVMNTIEHMSEQSGPITLLRLLRYADSTGVKTWNPEVSTSISPKEAGPNEYPFIFCLWNNIFNRQQVVDAGIWFWDKFYDEEQLFLYKIWSLPNAICKSLLPHEPLYFYRDMRPGGVTFNKHHYNHLFAVFFGCGKTSLCKRAPNCVDADDKIFAEHDAIPLLIEDAVWKVRNDYVVFLSATQPILDELHRRNLNIRLIMPSPEMKDEIIKRVEKRTTDPTFSQLFAEYYDQFYSIVNYPYITTIDYLQPGQYLSDVIVDISNRKPENA